MVFTKVLLTGFVCVSLCMANISGVVIDASSGVPVAGAVVRLEKGGLTATTNTDGFFTLDVNVTGILPGKDKAFSNGLYAKISGNRVSMAIEKKATVKITGFDFSGRTVFTICKTIDVGNQSIALPQRGMGVYLYKVAVGERVFVLKGNAIGSVSNRCSAITGEVSSKLLSKQGKATATSDDVIAVIKDGYLNYRSVIAYSANEIVIKMIVNAGNVTDVDGNVYQSVRIGNQVWMTENLRVTRYNDGTGIPLDTSVVGWKNATTPKYCYYDNTTNVAYVKKYGALYNWYVVNPANPRKIAPAGWHVPSNAEWDNLQNYLIANGYNWNGTTTGNLIAKSLAAMTDWNQSSFDGCPGKDFTKNNSSGFSALGGGMRLSDGFYGKNEFGHWWSSTGLGYSEQGYKRILLSDASQMSWSSDGWSGISIRLVRD